MHDAVVIGGGPAGSRLACRLAEKGHRVLVLERKKDFGNKCCTGIIGRECAEAFNIDSKVILNRVNSASIFSPAGNRLYVHREEIQACIIDRDSFDISMAEKAQRAGAEYRLGSLATKVTIEPGCAFVTASSNSKEEQFTSKTVIAACGFAPGLLQRLGPGIFRDFVYGAQAVVATTAVNEVEVYFGDMAPRFFAWLVPVSPGLARAGLLTRRKPGDHLKKWLDQLKSKGKIATTDVKIHFGVIPLKPPARTYGERLIAVGDAAGQVKPTSGGGIYYGLLCADIAAETLDKALTDDDLSAGRLSSYEKAWRRKLGRELRMGYRARKLFECLSYKQIDTLLRIAKAFGIEDAIFKADGISFDWHGRTARQLVKHRVLNIGRGLKTGSVDLKRD
jgi:digeranylgeranylglycerophospholipid reductase